MSDSKQTVTHLDSAWAALGSSLAEMVRRADCMSNGSEGVAMLRRIWESNAGLHPQLRRVYSSLGSGSAALTMIDFFPGES